MTPTDSQSAAPVTEPVIDAPVAVAAEPAEPPVPGDPIALAARFARPARGTLIVSAVLAIAAGLLEVLPYWVVYRAVEGVLTGTATQGELLGYALVGVGAVLGFAVLFGLSTTLSHRAAFGILFEIRLALARRLARLPLGYFGRTRSGEVKKTLIDGTEKLELLIAHALPDAVGGAAVWLGVTVWLFVVDWRLALASIVVVPIAFGCMSRAISLSTSRAEPYYRAEARMNGSIVEYLAGMPVVKVFNRSGEAFAETSRAVRDVTEHQTAWARAWIPLGGAFYSLVLANIVVILPVGSWLLSIGEIGVPTLLFFLIVGAHFSRPLLRLFTVFAAFAHISAGAGQIRRILDEPELPDTGARPTLTGHDIAFDGVGFGYDGRPVLHDVSFTARAGAVTALVGPSGAGKTTIARLVPRFADVTHGAVRIGGVDVRTIGVEALMETIAFVFQDTFLFHDTIAANIRIGRTDATDAQVAAAATAARCHEFVTALPDGYATLVGERGATLSGGERQRIAIARAILKDAPIVVLDEATAFADPENEAAIQDAISALAAGRTVLVVAHRLSTVVGVEKILVIDGGRVVESGRHDDLVARDGLYARLWTDFVDGQSVVLRR